MDFHELGLQEALCAGLAEQSITEPLEVQRLAIPLLLRGENLVAIAETGSGKTLAYALPLFQRLREIEASEGACQWASAPRGLIMTPTRELSAQVFGVLKGLSHAARLRVRQLMGGTERSKNRRDLSGAFDILVATPGRLQKFIEARQLSLSDLRLLVLDEADQLFAMGFLQELEAVLAAIPQTPQLALTSATLPSTVKTIIQGRFEKVEIVQSRAAHKPVASLRREQIQVSPKFKREELIRVLGELQGRGYIFCNSKARCDELADHLAGLGFAVARLHSELTGPERSKEFERFRSGEARLLVGTDLAARGLDVMDASFIINFDMPKEASQYLHRTGRVGRLGQRGQAIDLVSHFDQALVEALRVQRVRKSPFELKEAPGKAIKTRGGPARPEAGPRPAGRRGRGAKPTGNGPRPQNQGRRAARDRRGR